MYEALSYDAGDAGRTSADKHVFSCRANPGTPVCVGGGETLHMHTLEHTHTLAHTHAHFLSLANDHALLTRVYEALRY